jgi:hypothetical protein
MLDEVGHFLHLEAHDELVAALKELMAVPLATATGSSL